MRQVKPISKGTPSHQGFSMPEVLISSALLALVVSNSSQLFMKSGLATSKGSSRDAVAAAVAKDLESLRTKAFQYHCHSGPCSTQSSEIAKPISYLDLSDSEKIATMENRCQIKGLEEHMVETMELKDKNFTAKGVTIERTLTTSPDSNQLLVSYQATTDSPIKFSFNSSLIPTAEGWCP